MASIWSNTVGDLVRRSARRDPERVALVFGEQSWTYAGLDRAACRVARRLLELKLKKGDRVAAYGKNSDAYLILYLACARAGLVHVPVNFALGGEELAYIVNQSGCRALFADPSLAERVHAIRGRLGVAHHGTLRGGTELDVAAWATSGAAEEPGVEVRDEDLAQLLYTSGTTAAPRGAMLTHRALVHEYASCVAALDHCASDRPLHVLPLYHSAQMHDVAPGQVGEVVYRSPQLCEGYWE